MSVHHSEEVADEDEIAVCRAESNESLARYFASQDNSVYGRLAEGKPAPSTQVGILRATGVVQSTDLALGKSREEVVAAALALFDKGEPHTRAVLGELSGVANSM